MKIRVRMIFYGVLVSVCLGLAFCVFHAHRAGKGILYFADIGTYNVPDAGIEVNRDSSVGQSFVSNFDNLMMISVYVPPQKQPVSGRLYFHLGQKGDTPDPVTASWTYDQIRPQEKSFYVVHPARASASDGFHFHISFPVIKEARNKEFYFYFTSPDALKGEGIKLGFWDIKGDYNALKNGRAYINAIPVDGYMAFRTFNTFIYGRREIFSGIKARLAEDINFIRFWSYAAILAALALAGTYIGKSAGIKGRNKRKVI